MDKIFQLPFKNKLWTLHKLARKNDEAAKSNLEGELALLEENIKISRMNNKFSITNIQEDGIIQETDLKTQEVANENEVAGAVS